MSQINRSFKKELYEVKYLITSEHHDKRLDQFLLVHFESFSRQQVKKKIASGDISILNRNHKMKASTKVKEGETVIIRTFSRDEEPELWKGKVIPRVQHLEIIHDCKEYVIINKPPFMATHPTGKHLFYCATVMLEHQFNQKFFSVHRLDRETSGLMMLSKSAEHSKIVTPLFEQRKVQKTYYLVGKKSKEVSFPFTAHERLGTIEGFTPNLYTHCFPEDSPEGKSAQTHFQLLWEKDEYIGVLASPKTGRQHQIRAHAAHHGFALIGDKLYNGDPQVFSRFKDSQERPEDIESMIIPRHALHALELTLPEPFNKTFKSSIPDFDLAFLKTV